jgi:hypothetical protein
MPLLGFRRQRHRSTARAATMDLPTVNGVQVNQDVHRPGALPVAENPLTACAFVLADAATTRRGCLRGVYLPTSDEGNGTAGPSDACTEWPNLADLRESLGSIEGALDEP